MTVRGNCFVKGNSENVPIVYSRTQILGVKKNALLTSLTTIGPYRIRNKENRYQLETHSSMDF